MTRSMPQLPLVLPREEKMEEYEVSSVVRGFHVYQQSWSPSLEEQLECLREAGNDKDRYAVAVLRHGSVVGHIPRRNSGWLVDFELFYQWFYAFISRSNVLRGCG